MIANALTLIILWACAGFAVALWGLIMLEIQIARLKEARAAERQADAKWKAELLAALEDLIAELMPEVQKPEISVASPSKDKKHS